MLGLALDGLMRVGLMYSETWDVDDTIWTSVGSKSVGFMLMKVPTSGSMPGGSRGGRREVLSAPDAAGLSRMPGTEGRKVGLLGRDGSGGENVESTLPSTETGLCCGGRLGGVGRRGAKVVRRGGSLETSAGLVGLGVGRIGLLGSPSLSTGMRGRPCSSMGMKAVPSLSMGRIGLPSSSRGTTGLPLES